MHYVDQFGNLVDASGRSVQRNSLNLSLLADQNTPVSGGPAASASASSPSITQPTNSDTLNGVGTPAGGRTITSFLWTKLSGPSSFTLATPTAATTTVTGLAVGTYVFQLLVTQDDAQTATATTSITVSAATLVPKTRIQAENWNGASGAAIETTSDTGGGFNVGNLGSPGLYVEYLVYPNVSGSRSFSFRVAAQNAGGQITITEGGTTLAVVNVPQTGGYQTWQTVTVNNIFSLTNAPHLLRFTVGSVPWNLNWFEFDCYSQMVPQEVAINSNIHGYYEFLPQNYYDTGANYPLIIHLHGVDQEGSSPTQLTALLGESMPKRFSAGMTNSFTIGGNTSSFILLAPQMAAWHAGSTGSAEVQDMLTYALAHYNVDVNRIYIVGYSMGAGLATNYVGTSGKAITIAATIWMSTAAPDDTVGAANIAAANLPVSIVHNNGDTQVPYSQSTAWLADINSHSPTPLAVLTTFTDTVHDCWNRFVDPAATQVYAGVNGGTAISSYQWLLNYSRNS